MKYKSISTMSNNEIEQALHIIKPYSTLVRFEKKDDFIRVVYDERWNGKPCFQKLDLLPDDIYVILPEDNLDGEPIENGDILYKYRQFMIAKGYSDIWHDNPWA